LNYSTIEAPFFFPRSSATSAMQFPNFIIELDVHQKLEVLVTCEPASCVDMRPFSIRTCLPGFGKFKYQIGLPKGHEPSLDPNIDKTTVGGLASQNASSSAYSGFNTETPVKETEDFTVVFDVRQELNILVACNPAFCVGIRPFSFETCLPASGKFKYQIGLPERHEPSLGLGTDKTAVGGLGSQDTIPSAHSISSTGSLVERGKDGKNVTANDTISGPVLSQFPKTLEKTNIRSLSTVPETQISGPHKRRPDENAGEGDNGARSRNKRRVLLGGVPKGTDGISHSVDVCPSTPKTGNGVIDMEMGRN
jgi:hypothetical protein